MANAKFVKTAAAVALGASVITTAVAPGAASAATTYQIKDGKLYKNGKIAKGYVVYKSKLYKNGKLNKGYAKVGTGAKMKLYYNTSLKKGFKTANNETLLFKDGVLFKGYKQAGSNERLYKNGNLTTGWEVYTDAEGVKFLYNKGYLYTNLKTATRGGVTNLFENGKVAEGTKVFKDTLYVDGVKATEDQVLEGVLYVDGSKAVGTKLFQDTLYVDGTKAEGTVAFEDVVYVDGVKDAEKPEITAEDKTVEYGSEAVDVATLATVKDNSGEEIKAEAKISFDGKAVDAIDTKVPGVYTVTFTAKDKNGNEAEAKEVKVTVAEAAQAEVESVTAINESTIEVKFNKEVDEASATAVNTTDATSTVVTVAGAKLTKPVLSADGRTLTFTYELDGVTELKDATATVLPVVTKADAKVSTPKFVKVINFKDEVAPTIKEVKTVNKANKKVDATITFNKKLASIGAVSIDGIVDSTVVLSADGKSITITDIDAGQTKEVVISNLIDAVGNKTASVSTTIVTSEDTVAPTAVLTTDGTNIKVKFSEEVDTANAVVKGNGIVLPLGTIDADGFYTIDASSLLGSTATFLKDVKFEITGVTDLAGNPLTKAIEYTTTIEKVATVAPEYVNATVAADAKTITVDYDKEVALPIADATFSYVYTDEDGVLYKATGQTFTALAADAKLSADKKSVIYTVPTGTTLPNGSYTFTFGENTFTSTISVVAPTTPVTETVTATSAVTDNVITLTFNEVMDDSAKVVSNYKLAGKALPEGTTINFVGSKQVVEITLPVGSVDKNGERTLEISNVVAKSGNTLAPVVTPLKVTLTDNVAPTTNGVAVVSTSELATVTFSEDLKALSAAVSGLTVKVNGITLDSTKFTAAVTDGKLALTIDPTVKLLLTDKVTVELVKDTNLTDAAGNLAIVK